MRRLLKLKQGLLVFSIVVFSSHLSAQVTIGSNQPPAKGALLDLTQGATTEKGLGLPRVAISKQVPTTDAELASSIGGSGSYSMNDHIGLLVYNTDETHGVCKGLYVWNGTEWQALSGAGKKGSGGGTITMVDGDGNVYPTMRLGDPCQSSNTIYWTTQNVYTTKKKDGTNLPNGGTVHINPARGNYLYNGVIAITPGSLATQSQTINYGENAAMGGGKNITESALNFAKKFGLHYTYDQAIAACDNGDGWRLAGASDWDDLAVAFGGVLSGGHYEYAGAYLRVNHNYFVSTENTDRKWGVNDPSSVVVSGFKGYPAGYVDNGPGSNDWGVAAYWWTATATNARYLHHATDKFENKVINPAIFRMNARCVKNPN